jgi:hypothetical protein
LTDGDTLFPAAAQSYDLLEMPSNDFSPEHWVSVAVPEAHVGPTLFSAEQTMRQKDIGELSETQQNLENNRTLASVQIIWTIKRHLWFRITGAEYKETHSEKFFSPSST